MIILWKSVILYFRIIKNINNCIYNFLNEVYHNQSKQHETKPIGFNKTSVMHVQTTTKAKPRMKPPDFGSEIER